MMVRSTDLRQRARHVILLVSCVIASDACAAGDVATDAPLNTMVKQWAIDIWTSRGPGWHLIVAEDGRGQLDWGPADNVRFPAGTFEFATVINAAERQRTEPTSDGYTVKLVRRQVVVTSAEASQETNHARLHGPMEGLHERQYRATTTFVASVCEIARRAIENGKLDEPGYASRFGKNRKRDLTSLYRTWNDNPPTPTSKPLAHREGREQCSIK